MRSWVLSLRRNCLRLQRSIFNSGENNPDNANKGPNPTDKDTATGENNPEPANKGPEPTDKDTDSANKSTDK